MIWKKTISGEFKMWKKKKEEKSIPSKLAFNRNFYRVKEYYLVDGENRTRIFVPQFNLTALKHGETVDYLSSEDRLSGSGDWVSLNKGFDSIDKAKQVCYDLKSRPHAKKITFHKI